MQNKCDPQLVKTSATGKARFRVSALTNSHSSLHLGWESSDHKHGDSSKSKVLPCIKTFRWAWNVEQIYVKATVTSKAVCRKPVSHWHYQQEPTTWWGTIQGSNHTKSQKDTFSTAHDRLVCLQVSTVNFEHIDLDFLNISWKYSKCCFNRG